MSNSIKKFLASFFLFVILFSSSVAFLTPPAKAQTGTWYNQDFGTWFTKVYNPNNPNEIFGERYTAAQVEWIIYSVASFIINQTGMAHCMFDQNDLTQVTGCINDLFPDLPDAGAQLKTNETLLGAIFSNREISTRGYFEDVAQNFKLVPETHAQEGFGFSGLNVIIELWKITRNISYGLLVVVIIAMAFMIMFRVKLSPQVAISIQSALPKLVGAIILITFSYAIAGLLVDLMYVVIGLCALILSSFFQGGDPVVAFNLLTKGLPGGILGQDVNLGVFGLSILYMLEFFAGLIAGMVGTIGLVPILGVGAVSLAFGGWLIIVIMVLGLIAAFIIGVVAIFKIVVALLKAYATTLLLTISAPFQILMGTITPTTGFGSWLRSYVANLSTFVVIGVLFQISFLFLHVGIGIIFPLTNTRVRISHILWGTNPIVDTTVFVGGTGTPNPNAVERAWPPLLGGGTASVGLLFIISSFMIFTIIPKANQFVQAMIKGQQFNYGSAIGSAISPVTAPAAQVLDVRAKAAQDAGGTLTPSLLRTLSGMINNAGRG